MTTHHNLWACFLTPERHALTCNYWYTVTDRGGTPHTAFRTRAGLDRWLSERGLSLEGPLDEQNRGSAILGSYRTVMDWGHDAFAALSGERSRTLSNGDWVVAVLERESDGIVTVHTLNPNVRTRQTFDYRESCALMM